MTCCRTFAAAIRGLAVGCMPAGRGLAPLADVPDRHRRDGPPQLVIQRKHPMIAMPVLPRRRDEIDEPVEELKRRELDDAVGPRPRRRPPATRANPVGRLVSGQHVVGADDAAVGVADHGQSLEREGRPCTVSEKMLEPHTRKPLVQPVSEPSCRLVPKIQAGHPPLGLRS
jgi:hypothetical protein